MPVNGFVEYRKHEFCNDVKCPVRLDLNNYKDGSEEYEKIRQTCSAACKHSAWQFHHWLVEKGYLILRPRRFKER